MEKKELISRIKKRRIEAQLEGVEFKKSWRQECGKSVSAIANDENIFKGWLVIGINDDGTLAGRDTIWLKKTEQIISNHIIQYLEPSWAVKSITSEKLQSSHCLFIEIQNSQDVVKWNSKAYRLIGTTSSEMKPHEVMALSLRLPGSDFSKAKYESNSYDPALVSAFAQKVVEELNDFQIEVDSISAKDILRKLNLIETNTAGILFGDFSCRVVHFDSNGDILVQKTQKGLYRILSDEFIDGLQNRSRKKGTIVRGNSISAIEETPYPIKALREILANAVAHSLYQKNQGDIVVEIHPNKITVRNNCSIEAKAFVEKWFSRMNNSSNKHLMNTLRLAHITDEQGTGKIRVFRLMLEAGKREPIVEFDDLVDHGKWSITLFNEESNEKIKEIANEIKQYFEDDDHWRLATALLLWREYNWSKIESFLDGNYKYMANKVLQNIYCPVLKYKNRLFLKRWAKVKLTGKNAKGFTEGEKEFLYNFLSNTSFESEQEGNISSADARKFIGLSDSSSEMAQLARLFSEWQEQGRIKMLKRGHWKFIEQKKT